MYPRIRLLRQNLQNSVNISQTLCNFDGWISGR